MNGCRDIWLCMYVCVSCWVYLLVGGIGRRGHWEPLRERERENLCDFAVILMGRQFVMADEIYLPITPTSLKFMIISKTPLPNKRQGTGVP